MALSVLCVDDASGVADGYAKLIQAKTGLNSYGTADVDEALEIVATEPVTVVVLDQRMPKKSGTQLFRDMKKIKPLLKAIMLTGEADVSEAAEAIQLLDYVKVIDKTQIDALVPAVHIALARAEAEKSIDFEEVEIGRVGHRWWPFTDHSIFYLQSVDLVKDAHVPDSAWRLQFEINAGETKTISKRYSAEKNFTSLSQVESSNEAAYEVTLPLSKFMSIKNSLNTKISNRMQTQYEDRTTVESTVSEVITLPAEPANPIEQAVKARLFYYGPEVVTLGLRLSEHHVKGNYKQPHWIVVDHHTGHFINKQIDVLTNGDRIERITSRWP